MSRPRFSLNHVGIYVIDIDKMTNFYTEFMGFIVTDERTEVNPIRFLTMSPDEHHQLLLASGRAPESPSTVAQISFLMDDFASLRRLHEAAHAEPRIRKIWTLNHGNSWTVYFRDPEDNIVECYVHTPWHVSQPYGTPIDFAKSDREIWEETETAAHKNPTFMTAQAYRATIVGAPRQETAMKLASFSRDGRRSAGVVLGDLIADIGAYERGFARLEDVLLAGDAGLDRVQRIANTCPTYPLKAVTLHAPIRQPSKFLAIAANYQSHIDEVLAANSNYVPPTSQRWFAKLPSCVNDPFAPIAYPAEGSELDYEAELAVVIGRRCRRVKPGAAAEVIAGFTVCNDVSVRDWQKRSPTIMLGKSFDTHGPLGPWLVTPDEVGDPHALRITCTVNGETRQDGSTAEMINNCYEQIAYLSTVCTLEPGDVIATGTPKGTGAGMKPPRLLKVGDIVRCEVERVGAIEAKIVADGAS